MTTPPTTPPPGPTPRRGRRSAGQTKRRPDTATILAATLPVLALAGALLVAPYESVVVDHPPTEGQLERIDLGSAPAPTRSAPSRSPTPRAPRAVAA